MKLRMIMLCGTLWCVPPKVYSQHLTEAAKGYLAFKFPGEPVEELWKNGVYEALGKEPKCIHQLHTVIIKNGKPVFDSTRYIILKKDTRVMKIKGQTLFLFPQNLADTTINIFLEEQKNIRIKDYLANQADTSFIKIH